MHGIGASVKIGPCPYPCLGVQSPRTALLPLSRQCRRLAELVETNWRRKDSPKYSSPKTPTEASLAKSSSGIIRFLTKEEPLRSWFISATSS